MHAVAKVRALGKTRAIRINGAGGAVEVESDTLEVTLTVPTYEGETEFTLFVEPDADGDWRVFLPWPKGLRDEERILDNGVAVLNGAAYLGSPDVQS